MPIRGIKQAKARTRQILNDTVEDKARKTVTQMQILVIARAQQYMPREFGFLINSTFRATPEMKGGKMVGVIGNTESYAAPLHSPKAGGRMDGWQPKPPEDKFGPAWNPNAKQGWFDIGVREEKQNLQRVFKKGMKL